MVASLVAARAAGDVLPRGRFTLEQVLTNTARPSGLAIANDGRIFYGERTTGQIRVVQGGRLLTAPFATLSVASTGAGEGLIDVAIHPTGRWIYAFYTETGTRQNRVVRFEDRSNLGINPLMLLTLPASADGSRVGGSLAFGADGKLYVTVGDLATASNAQNESSNAGKVLRLNDDGSVPSDNPVPGSLVYAKGFRAGGGLAVNTTVGTFYSTDQGTTGIKEELNALPSGNTTIKNYAWDSGSGKLNNPLYVDPLVEHATVVTPAGSVAYTKSRFPAAFQNDVFYVCSGPGRIEDVDVTGVKLDTFGATRALYDPAADGDGTVDAACPKKWNDLALSPDGYVYATVDTGAASTQNGIYRIKHDNSTGPGEVSGPGSTHSVWVSKLTGSTLQLSFEDLERDAAATAPLAAGQHATKYTVWRGNLPLDTDGDGDADWSHTVAGDTNGTVVNDSTLSYDVTAGSGSAYFLISAQATHQEGTLGRTSAGAERPGYASTDYCDTLGIDPFTNGKCAPKKFVERGTSNELLLWDETGALRSLSEFRTGDVIHLDLGASDCFWCHVQADDEDRIEDKYRKRGFKTVLILEKNLGGAIPYADAASCAAAIAAWRTEEGGDYTILCDRDSADAGGVGDVWEQFNRASCNGFPQNYYIDRNWTTFDHVCGWDSSADTRIGVKAYPEWCE
jgi:glucose/arabinose dehydrogenase